jgi:hypothetical protein
MITREEQIDRFVQNIADAMRVGKLDALIHRIDNLLDTVNNDASASARTNHFSLSLSGLDCVLPKERKREGAAIHDSVWQRDVR